MTEQRETTPPTAPLMETSTEPSAETSVESPAVAPAAILAEASTETPVEGLAETSVETPAAIPVETLAETPAATPAGTSAATLAATSAVPPAPTSAETSAAPLAESLAAIPAENPAETLAATSAVPPAGVSAESLAETPVETSTEALGATPETIPAATSAETPAATPAEYPAVIPPMPEAPPLVSAPQAPVPVRKDRRVLRAVLRWTAAVVVFVVAGAGTAYGITQMKRTDVPGLATASDGRWDYPEITSPPLPSGSPGPFAADNKTNAHYADLRALVLPAPKGAKADASLLGTDGWLPTKTFLAQYADADDRKELGQKLTDDGLRHITSRGWTTQDGTRTRIYLLQFDTAITADELFSPGLISYDSPVYALTGAPATSYNDAIKTEILAKNVKASAYTEDKPYGTEEVRQAYLSAGDTLGLVVQSRKGVAKAVPFEQTLTLQSQLLD